MALIKEIKNRRSIRKFEEGFIIPDEDIVTLLEAARLSPSGTNIQPWRFIVVKDKQSIIELAIASYGQDYFKNCSCFIVCIADVYSTQKREKSLEELLKREVFSKIEVDKFYELGFSSESLDEGIMYAIKDTAIAIYSMMLQATHLGLGSCWVTIRDQALVRKLLEIPDDKYIRLVAMLAIGKPQRIPPQRPRLPLEKIVSFEKWQTNLETSTKGESNP